jgi:hypothetical protein
LATWLGIALLLGVALGLTVAAQAGRRRGARNPPAPADATAAPPGGPAAAPTPGPAREVDDLPGFLEHPPGSPRPPVPAAPPTPTPETSGATAAGATVASATVVGGPRADRDGDPAGQATRRTVLAMVVAAAVLVLVAVVIALLSRDEPAAALGTSAAPATSPPPATSPAPTPPPGPDREVEAGALAAGSVPLGAGGTAARASFGTVLLERRAVGVTVTRPGLSASTDGGRSLAHLVLPAWNCLSPEPPADPEAAGCARAATEYADLAGPRLDLSRGGDRLELAGRFPTYTRPHRGPPTYTGRSYPVSATLAADGPARHGRVPATGVLTLGPGSTPTTGAPGAVLQLTD